MFVTNFYEFPSVNLSPPALGAMVAWYRGDSFVPSLWSDKSGNGRHAPVWTYVSDGVSEATLISSDPSYNNRPTVSFDGNNYYEYDTWPSVFASGRPYTLAVVHNLPSDISSSLNISCLGSVMGDFFGQNYTFSSGWECGYQHVGSDTFHHLEYDPVFSPAPEVPRLSITTMDESNNINFYFNGSLDTNPSTRTEASSLDIASIRIAGTYGGDAIKFRGKIAEIIYYDKVLDSGEITALWAYIQEYYDIS